MPTSAWSRRAAAMGRRTADLNLALQHLHLPGPVAAQLVLVHTLQRHALAGLEVDAELHLALNAGAEGLAHGVSLDHALAYSTASR